jgi:hypothetical protein
MPRSSVPVGTYFSGTVAHPAKTGIELVEKRVFDLFWTGVTP